MRSSGYWRVTSGQPDRATHSHSIVPGGLLVKS